MLHKCAILRLRTVLRHFRIPVGAVRFAWHTAKCAQKLFYMYNYNQPRSLIFISHEIACMDSPTTEQLKKIILQNGFYHQPDLVAGKEVDGISERGFPFRTEEGLEFCQVHTFDNEVSE